jgi:hypothetical protein
MLSGQHTFRILDSARGGFDWDRSHGYSLQWNTWQDFQIWLKAEQRDNGIEFVRKNVRKSESAAAPSYLARHEFVCSRQGAGGTSKYVCKEPDRDRSIPSKRSECPCRLSVKIYPHTAMVLGMYAVEHTHEIGNANLKFTRLSNDVRDQVADLVKLGVETDRIVG